MKSTGKLFVVMVLAMVVTSCAAGATPDIEATVGAEVGATIAAAPTATPYPTHIPLLTHTPGPTYIPAATYIPYPTPEPSATPSPYLLQASLAHDDYTLFLEVLEVNLEDLGWVVEEEAGTIRSFLILDRQSGNGEILLDCVYGSDTPKVTVKTYYAINTAADNSTLLQIINSVNSKWHLVKVYTYEPRLLVCNGTYTFAQVLDVEDLSNYIQWYDKNIDNLVYNEMGLDAFLE